jgi:hypothetical protein
LTLLVFRRRAAAIAGLLRVSARAGGWAEVAGWFFWTYAGADVILRLRNRRAPKSLRGMAWLRPEPFVNVPQDRAPGRTDRNSGKFGNSR